MCGFNVFWDVAEHLKSIQCSANIACMEPLFIQAHNLLCIRLIDSINNSKHRRNFETGIRREGLTLSVNIIVFS